MPDLKGDRRDELRDKHGWKQDDEQPILIFSRRELGLYVQNPATNIETSADADDAANGFQRRTRFPPNKSKQEPTRRRQASRGERGFGNEIEVQFNSPVYGRAIGEQGKRSPMALR
jgi:hypothetical protein